MRSPGLGGDPRISEEASSRKGAGLLWFSTVVTLFAEPGKYLRKVNNVNELMEEIEDKWKDVLDSSDDWTERTLVTEFLDDLRELKRMLPGV